MRSTDRVTMRLILATTWGDLLRTFASDPLGFLQAHWYGIILLLLLLFALSRLNNYMEVNSVNRAINIARAFVGSIMAFVIAPIMVLILINVVAFLKGIPMFSFYFIWDWLSLTASSLWWIIRCATCFSCDNQVVDVAYNHHAVIRLAWILIPIIFIWWRSASTIVAKALMIPFILGVLFVTYQREASPTFLDKNLPESWRNFKIDNILNFRKTTTNIRDYVNIDQFRDRTEPTTDADRKRVQPTPKTPTRTLRPKKERETKPPPPTTNNDIIDNRLDQFKDITQDFKEKNNNYILLALLAFLLIAALLHFTTNLKLLALLFLVMSLGGFLLMSPNLFNSPPPESAYVVTDGMLTRFERLYNDQDGQASIELTNLSVEINERLREGKGRLSERYCQLYKPYFYDFCVY